MRARTVALLMSSIIIAAYVGMHSRSTAARAPHANMIQADAQETESIAAPHGRALSPVPGSGSLKVITIDSPHSTSSYAALESASQHDRGEAAFQIFQAIRICKSILAPTSIISPKLPRDFDMTWCSQIPEGADYMQWLRQSRDQGYLPAVLQMPRLPPEVRALPGGDPAATAAERVRLVSAMKTAAQAGSIEAMMWLGYAHLGDSEEDHVTNYSYCVAAQEDLQHAMSEGIVGGESSVARYAGKLSETIAHVCSTTLENSTAAEARQGQSIAQSFMASTPCCFMIKFPQ